MPPSADDLKDSQLNGVRKKNVRRFFVHRQQHGTSDPAGGAAARTGIRSCPRQAGALFRPERADFLRSGRKSGAAAPPDGSATVLSAKNPAFFDILPC